MNEKKLEGSIPKELGKLINLSGLGLEGNRLTGSIPSEFGKMTNLRSLNLKDYQVTGDLPAELGNLNESTRDFRHTPLRYPIGNRTKLEEMDLRGNQLNVHLNKYDIYHGGGESS